MTSKFRLLVIVAAALGVFAAETAAQPSRIHQPRGRTRGASRFAEPSQTDPPSGIMANWLWGPNGATAPANPYLQPAAADSPSSAQEIASNDTAILRLAERPVRFQEPATNSTPLFNSAFHPWLARTIEMEPANVVEDAPQPEPQAAEPMIINRPAEDIAATPAAPTSEPSIFGLAAPHVAPQELLPANTAPTTSVAAADILPDPTPTLDENPTPAEIPQPSPMPSAVARVAPPVAEIPHEVAAPIPQVAQHPVPQPIVRQPQPPAPAPALVNAAPRTIAALPEPQTPPLPTRSVMAARTQPPLQPEPQPAVSLLPTPVVQTVEALPAPQPAAPPQLKLIITGDRRIQLGQTHSCKAIVSNIGSTIAEDVSVLILLNGQRARLLAVGELHAGESRTLPFELSPQQSGTVGLNAVATASCGVLAVARGSVEVIEHNIELQLAGPRQVRHGEKADYALTIYNAGHLPAENMVVNVQFGNSSFEGLYQGSVPAGGQREVKFQVLPRQPGFQTLTATALCDGIARGGATAELRVQHGQLQVTATGPSMKLVGAEAIYTVQVKNIGDAAAQNVLMTAHLPDGVKFRHGVDKIDFYDGVTWSVGRLEAGNQQTFELRCDLLEAGTREISFVATADDGLRGSQEIALTVAAPAEVQLHVAQPSGPILVGEPVAYEIEVHNPAAKTARNVEITMQLDPSLRAIEIDGVPAQITPRGVVFQPIAELGPQQTRRIKVKVTSTEEGAHPFRVELSVADPNTFAAAEGKAQFMQHAITRGPWRTANQQDDTLRR